jgi:hypothetical protein
MDALFRFGLAELVAGRRDGFAYRVEHGALDLFLLLTAALIHWRSPSKKFTFEVDRCYAAQHVRVNIQSP